MPDRDRNGRDRPRRQYPVTSDEPVSLTRPRRAVQLTAVAYALAIVICSAVGSYVATVVAHERGSAHTDERIAALERDLTVRRAAAAEANARRDQQLRETERVVCVVFNRLEPRDVEVQAVRVRFRCDQQPQPSVDPSAGPPLPPLPAPSASGR